MIGGGSLAPLQDSQRSVCFRVEGVGAGQDFFR